MAPFNRKGTIDNVVLEALTTEIRVHQFIFFAVLVPLYILVAPIHSMEITIYILYDMVRQLLYNYFNVVIVSKEEINFRGYYFQYCAIALELFCFSALLIAFRIRVAGLFLRAGLFDGLARGRHMQPMPATLLSRYGHVIERAWRGSGYFGDCPKLYCFAAKGAIASAFEADGGAALGLSSGLLHRLNSGIDPTVEVMLQHEFAHISYHDNYQFDQILAIVRACRWILLGLASLVFVTFLGSGFVGVTTTGSLQPDNGPYLAYLKEALLALLYSVCVVIAVARYASLVIMLRELRADVRAGLAVGGLDRFSSTIASDRTVKQDGPMRLVSTLLAASVTHLTAAERLQYLQEPTRLLIPKFRYFAYSIALPLLLVMTDWVSFSDAQWILNIGILAVVLSGNLLTFLMLTDLGRNDIRIAFSRMIVLTLSCLALRGGFQNSRASLPATRNMQAVWSRD